MKRTHSILVVALLLSGTLAALVGFPPTVGAVDLTEDPVMVTAPTNTNQKHSLSMSASDSGRIYLAWSEKSGDYFDIMLSYSSNNGTTFAPAARVSSDAGSQMNSQVATANEHIYIVWEDSLQAGSDLTLARSEDGGMTFEEVSVADNREGTRSKPSLAASGDRVAVAWQEERSDNTIRIWRGMNGELVMELSGHQGAVRSSAFSPNRTYVASGSEDYTVKIWDAGTGALVEKITHHTREVTSVAWSPDGSILATGSFDNDVLLFNTTDFSHNRTLNNTNGTYNRNFVNEVAFSPDSGLVAVAYNGQYADDPVITDPRHPFNLTVWNLDDGTSWTRHRDIGGGHTNSVMDVAFSHNGTHVASCSKDGTLKIWDSITGQRTENVLLNQQALSLSWSPDDRFIAAGLVNGTVVLVNTTDTTHRIWMGSHTGRVNSLDWGIVKNEILTGASDPVAKVWHEIGAYFGSERLNLPGHVNSVYSVGWSSDAQYILTAGGTSSQHGMGETQIFCAISNDAGRTFSPPVMVADTCAGNRFSPEVAMDPTGNISVVWYDHRKGNSHIYFANSTDRGTSFGRNLGIDTQNKDCVTPKIFADDSGTAHVVWQHGERVGTPPFTTDMPGRAVRYANSTDNFAETRLMASGNHTQIPRISGSPDGRSIWVTWRFRDIANNTYHIKAAASHDNGTSFADSIYINSTGSFINDNAVFVDRYNQTSVAWETGGHIYHRTTVLYDQWPPSIVSTYPENGDEDISIFTPFTIWFSEPMDRVSVETAFSWTDGETTWGVGDCVGNSGSWNPYGDRVRFTPKVPLQYLMSTYSFTIAYTATDLAGNLLGTDSTFSFMTSEDMDPPLIEHYPSQDTVSYDEEYTVMAIIKDQWGTVEEARLFYQGVGAASPDASVEMSYIGSDTYQATIPAQNSLGTIYYYIWAADAFNNRAWEPADYTNQSRLYNVSVVDMVKPEISHVPLTEADVFRDIEVWAVVTDAIELQDVWLNYRSLGSAAYTQAEMLAVDETPNTFSQFIPAQDNIGMIHYNITAVDASGNFNTTAIHSVRIVDRLPPLINSVTPELLDNQTRVRVRANITDDVEVGPVTLYFKAVGGDQWVERPMNHISGDIYEFTIPAQRRSGSIHYYVNATDSSGNLASTLFERDQFQIEVLGVGPNYTLYYALGIVLAALIAILAYLLVRRFSDPGKADGPVSEVFPVEEETPPVSGDESPEKVDEAP